MSRHFDLEADLQHLNLEFNESAFGILDSPFTTNAPAWDVPGDGLLANTYECQELNQAIQLSGYLQPINPLIEGIVPLPPCFCGPPLQPNLMDIPRPFEVDFNAEYARFKPGSEMHSNISSVYPGLLDKVATAVPTTFDSDIEVIPKPIKRSRGRPTATAMPTTYDSYMAKTREPIRRGRGRPTATAVPITSESYMAKTQEPIKRGRGRPKGSKTKQRHPSKPKTPEEKAQAKKEKAAIRLANKKTSQEAKDAERKVRAERKAILNATRQEPLKADGDVMSMAPEGTLW